MSRVHDSMSRNGSVGSSNKIDFAALYQYCLVLNANDNGDGTDSDGESYVKFLKQNGLDCFLFMSFDKKEAFVLLRVPRDKLSAYCDSLDYRLLLDDKKLEEVAAKGFPEHKIAPITIAHNTLESKLKPFEYIYAPYKVDVPMDLYWHPPDDVSPFRELLQDKITLALIEARPRDGGEPLTIDRNIRHGKMKAFFPLQKPLKRDYLKKMWMKFNPFPWTEPSDDIKGYLGEKIGLYFSFLHHYSEWLIVPALIGLVLQVIIIKSNDFSSPVLPFFAGFMCLWSHAMLEFWIRKERYIALKWGMIGFEATDQDRPEFKGERVKSYVDGRDFIYYPSYKKKLKRVNAYLIIGTLILAVVGAVSVAVKCYTCKLQESLVLLLTAQCSHLYKNLFVLVCPHQFLVYRQVF